MKTTKRLISALLAALLTLSLAACNNGDKGVNIPASQNVSNDFQKNMHQSDYYRLHDVCETESGYYLNYSFVYYVDKATKQITILCAKPECEHNDDSCNARLKLSTFWTDGERIFYTNSSLLEENGKLVDHGNRIYAIDMDGTHQTVIQDLEFVPSGSSTHVYPIFHRGYVYFFYSGVLYKMPLGGDLKKSAEVLWGEEIANDDRTVFDSIPVGHNFTLWADGDYVYFMVNVQQPDGTYKDTLFAYNTAGSSEAEKAVRQVWQTPDADTVGQWTSAGVAVSKWYVMDGYIYFYLSGGDYWRCNLNTGESEKLADTHEKTTYGKAIFADGTMCLLNSVPRDRSLPGFTIVGDRYDYDHLEGGDTFYVYGLDGSFVKELPLASLYGEFPDIVNVEPVFCANGEIWFVAEQEHSTGQTGTAQGGFLPVGGVKTYDYTLCCVNIETGKITQIINWHRE